LASFLRRRERRRDEGILPKKRVREKEGKRERGKKGDPYLGRKTAATGPNVG
jgi:hypothetical protein